MLCRLTSANNTLADVYGLRQSKFRQTEESLIISDWLTSIIFLYSFHFMILCFSFDSLILLYLYLSSNFSRLGVSALVALGVTLRYWNDWDDYRCSLIILLVISYRPPKSVYRVLKRRYIRCVCKMGMIKWVFKSKPSTSTSITHDELCTWWITYNSANQWRNFIFLSNSNISCKSSGHLSKLFTHRNSR